MKISDEKNKYKRPKVTKQDIISNNIEIFSEKLKNFIEIHPENYCDIETGIWIKYISKEEGKYRSGGALKLNNAPEYFVLINPYTKLSWSVNLDKNIILMKDIGEMRNKMIEKNNLYKLYQEGLVQILDE